MFSKQGAVLLPLCLLQPWYARAPVLPPGPAAALLPAATQLLQPAPSSQQPLLLSSAGASKGSSSTDSSSDTSRDRKRHKHGHKKRHKEGKGKKSKHHSKDKDTGKHTNALSISGATIAKRPKNMEQLRAERLRREETERDKARRLLMGALEGSAG